jgi:hypothetical protein
MKGNSSMNNLINSRVNKILCFRLHHRYIVLIGLVLFFGLIVSACSQTDANTAEPTGVESVCEINRFSVIALSREQGSLVQWSPDGKAIAFISPSTSSSRLVGNLQIAKVPDFEESETIGEWAVGGLVWSPDGSQIAYTKLRTNDKMYTVAISALNGLGTTDLFPGAAASIDEWASPKTVKSWATASTLKVDSMCGPGCVETITINPATNERTVSDSIYKKNVWEVTPQPTSEAANKDNPIYMPVQSQSKALTAYFDATGRIYLLAEDSSQPISLMADPPSDFYAGDTWTMELQWYQDTLLAARINDKLILYDIGCAIED